MIYGLVRRGGWKLARHQSAKVMLDDRELDSLSPFASGHLLQRFAFMPAGCSCDQVDQSLELAERTLEFLQIRAKRPACQAGIMLWANVAGAGDV